MVADTFLVCHICFPLGNQPFLPIPRDLGQTNPSNLCLHPGWHRPGPSEHSRLSGQRTGSKMGIWGNKEQWKSSSGLFKHLEKIFFLPLESGDSKTWTGSPFGHLPQCWERAICSRKNKRLMYQGRWALIYKTKARTRVHLNDIIKGHGFRWP